jgi:hypothetical protein
MIEGARFSMYRGIVTKFLTRGFADHPVEPIVAPVDTTIQYVAHDDLFPGLPLPGVWLATSFLPSDHAAERTRRTKVILALRAALVRLAPDRTPPVPADEEIFLREVYPDGFRKVWDRTPVLPPELRDTEDPLAVLAVRGPFASLLRKPRPDEVAAGEAEEDEYVVDLTDLLDHPTYDGLVRPGGKAVLAVGPGGDLATRVVYRPDGIDQELARRAMVAGMNEDTTTFRHNLCLHNVVLTDVAIASINQLGARHPVRRVLQHTFHTLLIGNRENSTAQLAGPLSFAVTLFSHPAEQVSAIAKKRLAELDFFDFDPDEQFARRGTTETPFAYPYRDNVLELWAATLDYVREYLALYYLDDASVRADAALVRWADELDRLLPRPLSRPDGGLTREWVARVCATVIHLSTVEHDILNNVVWDYGTFSFVVPSVVPASGEQQDQLRAFDMFAVLFLTWRPFNMLLDSHVESLALDGPGRRVMQSWLDRLREIQSQMEARGHDPSLAYPANLNVSITN